MPRAKNPETRRTLCTSCDLAVEFAAEAKSISCPHCHTRVITEEMDVDGYIAVRRFTTANRMRIKKKGRVYASVRADELDVDGYLQGEAVSLTTIRLSKDARVYAHLRAPSLSLEWGATLVGDVRIGPDEVPELDNLARPSREEVGPPGFEPGTKGL